MNIGTTLKKSPYLTISMGNSEPFKLPTFQGPSENAKLKIRDVS